MTISTTITIFKIMANYNDLKTAIQQVIRTNGNEEITGALLQQSLVSMISSLGAGFQFMGVATPETNPGTPDQKVFYLVRPGNYVNFSSIEIMPGTIGVLYYDTQWHKSEINMSDIIDYSIFSVLLPAQQDWKDAFAEIYIEPKYLVTTKELTISRYQNILSLTGLVSRGTGVSLFTWQAKYNKDTTTLKNGIPYPLVCTTSTFSQQPSEAEIGDVVGYFVFKDVTKFSGTMTIPGNWLNMSVAINRKFAPIISNIVYGECGIAISKVSLLSDTLGINAKDIFSVVNSDVILDYLIDNTGTKISLNTGRVSQPIYLESGYLISMRARSSQYTSAISKSDAQGTTFTPVCIGVGGGAEVPEQDIFYVVEDSGYYVFSWVGDIVRLEISKNGADNVEKFNLLSAYDDIVYAGDSLTYSQVSTSATQYRPARKIYPNIIADISGNNAIVYAVPGYTPKQWWNAYKDNLITRTNALYMIYLGTNGGLTDTIDTDCPDSQPVESYADTQTGYYGRIMKTLYDLGEKAILVLVNVAPTTPGVETTNVVIKKFADKFNFAWVKNDYIYNRIYRYYPNMSGYDKVHLNDMGYAYFANRLIKDIADMPEHIVRRLIK